jgi:DNA-binding protein HU-beta
MVKRDFFRDIADRAGITRHQAEEAYEAIVSCIIAELYKSGKAVLQGFGTFSISKRQGRIVISPISGPVPVPAHHTINFRPCLKVKEGIQEFRK